MAKQDRRNSFKINDLDRTCRYGGGDLGASWTKRGTAFRLWAPSAEAADLLFYARDLDSPPTKTVRMRRGPKGTWTHREPGDLHGTYYTYRVTIGSRRQPEAVDPYAKAVGANGMRGMIVDLSRTNPPGWVSDLRPPLKSFTDSIIYELHIRDLSTHSSSGIRHKGRFLGLTEAGTRSPTGERTGLDHLVDLGITHLHLLPSFDFVSVDETRPGLDQFNWGYDPQNYNVPEGSYSTNPRDGAVRIREFKEMVRALHAHGIRVVMDVVYNHTGRTPDSNFNLLVPRYYYREDGKGGFSNGSGCGNETASERFMMRKFMVDSVVYWAREYHVDGFRFDLMGLHDITTMNAIRRALDRVDPSILLYGEPWGAGPSPFPADRLAHKANTSRLNRIAAFSDDLRDGVKGYVFQHDEPGFANGLAGREEAVKFGVVAATRHPQVDGSKLPYSRAPWARQPFQCVNYVSCHDNHTLWDRLAITNPRDSEAERIRMDVLCQAIVLTAQGIAFLHAGEEMLRTKRGNENSYNAPDRINQLDWTRKAKYRPVYRYYRGLIALRKAHPAFRMGGAAAIRRHLKFLKMPAPNMVGFVLAGHANGDPAGTLVVIYNANRTAQDVSIPRGAWNVLADDRRAGAKPLRRLRGSVVRVPHRSAMVLAQD